MSPAVWRFKAPYPKPLPAGPQPAGKDVRAVPIRRSAACRSASSMGRKICWSTRRAAPMRIDKAYSWEAPLAAHGLMHTVIRNAWAGDPYPDRHAVHVHGQHGMELVDEHRRDHVHADRQGSRRQLQDPVDHLFRRLLFRDGAFADLVLPDTTYLERHDCISLLDRPISSADGPGDAICQPVLKPDRDVRPFQSMF